MRQVSLLPFYSSGETESPALGHDSSLAGHEADQYSWWNSIKSSHYDGSDNAGVLGVHNTYEYTVPEQGCIDEGHFLPESKNSIKAISAGWERKLEHAMCGEWLH